MLTVASKFMAVEVDERIPMVRECLPGANCGACGFAGCDDAREAHEGHGHDGRGDQGDGHALEALRTLALVHPAAHPGFRPSCSSW